MKKTFNFVPFRKLYKFLKGLVHCPINFRHCPHSCYTLDNLSNGVPENRSRLSPEAIFLTVGLAYLCIVTGSKHSFAGVVEIETKPILVTTKAKTNSSPINSSDKSSQNNPRPSEPASSPASVIKDSSWQQISYSSALAQSQQSWKDSEKGNQAITEKLKKLSQDSEINETANDMAIKPRMNETKERENQFIGNDADTRILKAAQPSGQNYSISGGQSVSPDGSAFIKEERTLEIGTEVSHIVYKEPVFDLKEKGWMYGLFGSYLYRPAQGSYLRNNYISLFQLDLKGSYGQVDYESTSGTIDDIDDYMFEVRGLVGQDFYIGKNSLITPFSGLGWRYLNDDSSGRQVQSGAYGYQRESRYFYAPLGVEAAQEIGKNWLVSLTGEYDFFITGEQTSHLSDVPGGYPDIKNKQHDGYGARGSLRIARLGEAFNVLVEPYIRYWHIDDSDVSTASGSGFIVTGLEPENNSTEIGVKLGVQY